MPTAAPRIPIRYFVSYTRLDKSHPAKLLDLLTPHFAISRRFEFSEWRDVGIFPGEDWNHEIHLALEACRVGLLLLSPGYFSRPYIVNEELPHLFSSGKVVIPVLLKPIDSTLHGTRGLERLQIFRFDSAFGPRAFSECASVRQREDFALALYQQIERRPMKTFP